MRVTILDQTHGQHLGSVMAPSDTLSSSIGGIRDIQAVLAFLVLSFTYSLILPHPSVFLILLPWAALCHALDVLLVSKKTNKTKQKQNPQNSVCIMQRKIIHFFHSLFFKNRVRQESEQNLFTFKVICFPHKI